MAAAFGRRLRVLLALAVLALACAPAPVQAQQQPQQQPDKQEALRVEFRAALRAAVDARTPGPADIALGDQGRLTLPRHYNFIPRDESSRLLRAMGNQPGDTLLGLVVDEKPFNGGWFVVVRYEPAGYIKDDDAKDWDADGLLKSLKEGTEAANQERRERGLREIEVTGWIERPRYDAAAHRLVWSAGVEDKGAAGAADQDVNYNTYVLGREGYFSLNLITAASAVEAQKPLAGELLAATEFGSGKGYGDFNASTDRVAAYGLAALIGGIAAKKLGLLALAAVAMFGGVLKLFRRRKQAG